MNYKKSINEKFFRVPFGNRDKAIGKLYFL